MPLVIWQITLFVANPLRLVRCESNLQVSKICSIQLSKKLDVGFTLMIVVESYGAERDQKVEGHPEDLPKFENNWM